MPLKTLNYTAADGRDKGKFFVITEMAAEQIEDWAGRAMFALISNNIDVPDNFQQLGMAGLVELGFKALSGLKWEVAKPLFSEMLTCVEIIPDPSKTHVKRALVPSDIEEVSTRLKLRVEVWKLHTDFFDFAGLSKSPKEKPAIVQGRVTRTSRR